MAYVFASHVLIIIVPFIEFAFSLEMDTLLGFLHYDYFNLLSADILFWKISEYLTSVSVMGETMSDRNKKFSHGE